MEKLKTCHHTLAGRGLSNKVDNSWLSEYEWGKHTLQPAYVHYKDTVNHHCTVCCNDEAIVLILIADADDPKAQFSRARQLENTYIVKYSSLDDVELTRSVITKKTVKDPKSRVFSKPEKEYRRQSLSLYFLNSDDGKNLSSLW
jgi:hypothetical protein